MSKFHCCSHLNQKFSNKVSVLEKKEVIFLHLWLSLSEAAQGRPFHTSYYPVVSWLAVSESMFSTFSCMLCLVNSYSDLTVWKDISFCCSRVLSGQLCFPIYFFMKEIKLHNPSWPLAADIWTFCSMRTKGTDVHLWTDLESSCKAFDCQCMHCLSSFCNEKNINAKFWPLFSCR